MCMLLKFAHHCRSHINLQARILDGETQVAALVHQLEDMHNR